MMRIPQLTSLQGLSALSPSREQELRAIGNDLAEGHLSAPMSPQFLAGALRPFTQEEQKVIAGSFVTETLDTNILEKAFAILANEAFKKKLMIGGAVVGVGLVGYFLLR